jgi:hypothetical protein
VAGIAVDGLYTAILLSFESIPAEAGDLLGCVWMLLFFAVAPSIAATLAYLLSTRAIAGDGPAKRPSSDTGVPTTRRPIAAAIIAAGAVFSLALCLLFLSPILGLLA